MSRCQSWRRRAFPAARQNLTTTFGPSFILGQPWVIKIYFWQTFILKFLGQPPEFSCPSCLTLSIFNRIIPILSEGSWWHCPHGHPLGDTHVLKVTFLWIWVPFGPQFHGCSFPFSIQIKVPILECLDDILVQCVVRFSDWNWSALELFSEIFQAVMDS